MDRPVASTAVTRPVPVALVRWWRILTGVVRALISGTARPDLLRRYERAIGRIAPRGELPRLAVAFAAPALVVFLALATAASHLALVFLVLGVAAIGGARHWFPAVVRAGRDALPLEVVAAGGAVLLALSPFVALGGLIGSKGFGLIVGGVYVAVTIAQGRRGMAGRLGGRAASTPIEAEVRDALIELGTAQIGRAPAVRFLDDPVPNVLTFVDVTDASLVVVTSGFVQLPAGPRRALLQRALVARAPGLSLAPAISALLLSVLVQPRSPWSRAHLGIAKVHAAIAGQQRVLVSDEVAVGLGVDPVGLADGLLAIATGVERNSTIDQGFAHLWLVDPQPYDARRARDRAHPTLLRRVASLRARGGAPPLGAGLSIALADEH